MKHLFLLILLVIPGLNIELFAQNSDADNPLQDLLKKHPEFFQRINKSPDSFRIQIMYTQVDRNKKNKPRFKEYGYRINNQEYFYPASTVKMPIALLALEKLNELAIPGLTMNSIMITDSATDAQDFVYNQPNAMDGAPTIANYIKQIFLVSDNDAFNRLYEFLGPDYIQKKLKAKGYGEAIIRHRLQVNKTVDQQLSTNPVKFYDTSGNLIYEQSAQISKGQFAATPFELGKGFMKGGKLIETPFSFFIKKINLVKTD